MEQMIPLSVPNLKGKELEYVTHAVETEWVSTAGPYIVDFENQLKKYVGAREAVACQSGTSGIHLALLACGIKQGEEVIVPTLTFIAAVNPVKYIGAEPVFMDCDDNMTIDAYKLEEFLQTQCYQEEGRLYNKDSGRPVTAIIAVHIFGNMADMEKLLTIADKYNLKLIEDATEALGTYYKEGKYKGRFAGTMGDVGVYSFNGNKIITTGGGGMLVSDKKEYAEYCRHLSTQAKADVLYFDHDEIGYNYRMTNLQAALGLAQLEQLESFIERKEANYLGYQKLGVDLLEFRKGIRPNYWFYSYITENRDCLLKFLESKRIQSRPIWKLIHELKPYRNHQVYRIEKAIYFYNHVLNIPCSTNLSETDVRIVADSIINFNSKQPSFDTI